MVQLKQYILEKNTMGGVVSFALFLGIMVTLALSLYFAFRTAKLI